MNEDLNVVTYFLDDAKKYNLENEVVAYALKALKENPKLSIQEAITSGYFEWVK